MLNLTDDDKKFIRRGESERQDVRKDFVQDGDPEEFFDMGAEGMIRFLTEIVKQAEADNMYIEVEYEDNRWDEIPSTYSIYGKRTETFDERDERILKTIKARKREQEEKLEQERKRVEASDKAAEQAALRLLKKKGYEVFKPEVST